MAHPRSMQKVLLIQADKDTVADGSVAKFDSNLLKSTSF